MKLTNNNIAESILKLEQEFKNNIQLRFMIEEVLLDYQKEFGDQIDYEIVNKKCLVFTK